MMDLCTNENVINCILIVDVYASHIHSLVQFCKSAIEVEKQKKRILNRIRAYRKESKRKEKLQSRGESPNERPDEPPDEPPDEQPDEQPDEPPDDQSAESHWGEAQEYKIPFSKVIMQEVWNQVKILLVNPKSTKCYRKCLKRLKKIRCKVKLKRAFIKYLLKSANREYEAFLQDVKYVHFIVNSEPICHMLGVDDILQGEENIYTPCRTIGNVYTYVQYIFKLKIEAILNYVFNTCKRIDRVIHRELRNLCDVFTDQYETTSLRLRRRRKSLRRRLLVMSFPPKRTCINSEHVNEVTFVKGEKRESVQIHSRLQQSSDSSSYESSRSSDVFSVALFHKDNYYANDDRNRAKNITNTSDGRSYEKKESSYNSHESKRKHTPRNKSIVDDEAVEVAEAVEAAEAAEAAEATETSASEVSSLGGPIDETTKLLSFLRSFRGTSEEVENEYTRTSKAFPQNGTSNYREMYIRGDVMKKCRTELEGLNEKCSKQNFLPQFMLHMSIFLGLSNSKCITLIRSLNDAKSKKVESRSVILYKWRDHLNLSVDLAPKRNHNMSAKVDFFDITDILRFPYDIFFNDITEENHCEENLIHKVTIEMSKVYSRYAFSSTPNEIRECVTAHLRSKHKNGKNGKRKNR
ncbi:hypothetical protein, conserved [Plasmodium ovale wallikeri]|uniref:Uncharacterized protein n=1 Tax=Plasmodium ovale wallikeri TaxID=864142 RepID=A0A1A8YHM9_PLAOA|nr:hypothetical protein, conserved [Plasmodium ovale wallikeri]